jgi:hypothetical protein
MISRLYALIVIGALVAVVLLLPLSAAAGQGSPAPSTQNSCMSDDPALFWRCAQQRVKTFNPPRTADGKPDLNGYWRNRTRAQWNLEGSVRTIPEEPGGEPFGSGSTPEGGAGGKAVVVDPPNGKVPYQAWARAQSQENTVKYIDQNASCFLSGALRHMYVSPAHQIIQTPDYIAIPTEEAHGTRLITMAKRPHLGKDILLWQGDARGRWEGNTLVVESTNHNGRVFLDRQGTFYTDAAILTERFMMVDANTIAYTATVDDPLVYTRPFTIALAFTRHTTVGFEIWEDACFEGDLTAKRLEKAGLRMNPGITSKDVPGLKNRAPAAR